MSELDYINKQTYIYFGLGSVAESLFYENLDYVYSELSACMINTLFYFFLSSLELSFIQHSPLSHHLPDLTS